MSARVCDPTENPFELDPPPRSRRACNGGPNGRAWCGADACFVGNDGGLEWFCCAEHTEGKPAVAIELWFKRAAEKWAAEAAVGLIRWLKKEGL